MPNLLTVREAAAIFYEGLPRPAASVQYLYSLIGRGLVEAEKIGSKTYVSEDSLRSYMANNPRRRSYSTRPTPEECGLSSSKWVAIWQLEELTGYTYNRIVNFCFRNHIKVYHSGRGGFLPRDLVKTQIPGGPLLDLDMSVWMLCSEFLTAVDESSSHFYIKLRRNFSDFEIKKNVIYEVGRSTRSVLAVRRSFVKEYIQLIKPSISEDVVSQADAARMMGVSRQAINSLISQGKLSVRLVGKKTYVDIQSLNNWMQKRQAKNGHLQSSETQ